MVVNNLNICLSEALLKKLIIYYLFVPINHRTELKSVLFCKLKEGYNE
ncbi:MAG: hypothetical protein HFI87_05605 [Bacilli bacterium]|nr:hypothetical protein [Bacilli bacterium]